MRLRIPVFLTLYLCGAAYLSYSAVANSPETITVSPTTATLTTGAQKTFSAKVAGVTPAPVLKWSVVSTAVTSSGALGTVTSSGVYTAPASVPTPATVYVRASDPTTATIFGQATVTLENAAPTLTSVAPTSINTGLAYTLTLTGTNFLASSQVLFDGVVVPSTFVSSTQITVQGKSVAAAGTTIQVTVGTPNDGSKVSGARSVTVEAPVQVTLTPDKKTIRAGSTLTLSPHVVNNSDQVVTWKASAGSVDSKNVYTAPADLPAGAVATVTAISKADPTKSAVITVNLQNPVPVISAISPSPLTAGAASFTVTGTGFAQGAKVLVSGTPLTTTWVNDTKLTVTGTIPAQLGRVAAVKVVNPDPGTATSVAFAVKVSHVANEKMAYADAVRFLEMASWGPTPAAVQHLQQIGRDAWLTEQFNTATTPYPLPTSTNEGVGDLQTAFFTNGLTAPDQLRLRVAFALHSIFVVSGNKDTNYWQMAPYLKLLSDNAFGSYRNLLGVVTLNPGMGFYLDMVNNDKANPAKGTAPNENYAREVMQLFTIGLTKLDSMGNSLGTPTYSQKTVTEMAKVFTGWTYAPAPNFASQWTNAPYYFDPMVAFEAHHDETSKDLSELGCPVINAPGSAAADLNAALNCLAGHPNAAPFISYRLIQRLVTSSPSPAYVSRVVTAWGTTGNLKNVITAILTDTEATTSASKLREPVLYATTLYRALNASVLNNAATGIASQTKTMGQDALIPGSVFSYFSPAFHVSSVKPPVVAPEFQSVNTSTSLARPNFVYKLVNGQVSGNVKVDLSSWQDLASDADVLVEAVNQALYRGGMTANEKTTVKTAILAATSPADRVKNAVYVAAGAPQYQVEN